MTTRTRRTKKAAVALASTLLLASCERDIEYVQARDVAHSGDKQPVATTIDLSAADVEQLKAEAIRGDNTAAMTLYLHYDAVGDRSASQKWLELAANRGDCDSIIAIIWELESEGASRANVKKWRNRRDELKCRSTVKYQYRKHN